MLNIINRNVIYRIRAKFEEMRNTSKSQRSERPQVHRFVVGFENLL